MLKLQYRLLPLACLLGSGLLFGCAHAPEQPPPVTPSLALPAIAEIVVHGPAEGADLEAALQVFNGREVDADLRAATEAYVRDYYDWLEWRNVRVIVDSATDARGQLHVIVLGDAPAELDELPALASIEQLEEPPVPPPVQPGGARKETALDASFQPWLRREKSRVLIDAGEKRLYLKHPDGGVISYAVAVGTARTPTPAGEYTIEGIRHKPTWYPPASIRRDYARKGKSLASSIPPGPGNPLGSYFVRLQNGIGIHGTNQPRSIGRAASYGCIRMHDRDVRELIRSLRNGDGVTVIRARNAVTAQN